MKTYCALCKCWYDENNQKTRPPEYITDASTNADPPGSKLIDATPPEPKATKVRPMRVKKED